jgi:DNA-binding response OmpR family regulator
MRILVIEDETKVARALTKGLGEKGHEVSVSLTGEEGFYQLATKTFDMVILDLMLPGRDGLQVLRDLRARNDRTPVLILTARDAVEDRVIGLDAGADDYLVKPFAFAELLARVRAIARRGRPEGASPDRSRLLAGDLVMDFTTRTVSRSGCPIELTGREFQLLEYLLRAGGAVVTRAMLSRDIWGETGEVLNNSIDVYMSHLRAKVDQPFGKKLIQTVRGVGFRLRE